MRIGSLVLCLLVGCSSCDGERAQKIAPPRPPSPTGSDDGTGTSITPPIDAEYPHALGFLDAPAGTLDAFFDGLAAAERLEPNARVDMLFFGDSHTAGDSMTERLRISWQTRFGDAGRGLVAA